MRFLRTNTAVIVTVGPFYDKTDGVTIETALTITNERITLTADTDDGSAPTNILDNVTGATSGTANDLNYISGNDAGMMQLELSAANVNRLGRMFLSITDAANHVPVFHEFMVLPAMIYDAFVAGTDVLDASVTQILGSAVSTSTAQLGVNAVQAGGTAWASGAITAAAIAADAITAAKVASDVSAEIADAVWDEDATGHQTQGTFGQAIGDPGAEASTIFSNAKDIYPEIFGIRADTEDIQFRLPSELTANGNMKSSLVEILTTALTETAGLLAGGFKKFFNVAAPTGTLLSIPDAAPAAIGGLLTAPTTANTGLANVTQLGGVVQSLTDLKDFADDGYDPSTNKVQGVVLVDTVTTLTNAPADSAGVTTLLSRLSALRAGYLDNLSAGAVALEASLQALITTVGAAGAGLTATASAVWAVATRLLTAGTNIVLAKGVGVTGFTDLSAAQVNAEADAALADYDGPTKAELDSAVAPLALEATAQDVKAVTDRIGGLIEDVSGDRFTAKALEEAPTGGSAPTASEIADEVETREHILTSAYDAAKTAASQTSVNDLPTNSELATALAAADDAVLALLALVDAKTTNLPSDPADQSLIIAATNALMSAITALNNLSAAQVRTELSPELDRIDVAISTRAPESGGNVAAIKSKTDNLPALPAAVSDIPTAAQNADALLDRSDAIETGITLRGALRVVVAAEAGKVSGAETTEVTIRDVADLKNRIVATVDADGNRSATAVDVS